MNNFAAFSENFVISYNFTLADLISSVRTNILVFSVSSQSYKELSLKALEVLIKVLNKKAP